MKAFRALFFVLATLGGTAHIVLSVSAADEPYRVVLAPDKTDINSLAVFYKVGTQNADISPAIGSVKAGETLDFSWKYGAIGPDVQTAFLGAYGDEGVSVTVDSTIADALVGRSWESIFKSEEFSESAVRNALTSFTDSVGGNDQYDFIRSLASYLSTLKVDVDGTERELFPSVGNEATILNFSNAYKNGVAMVSPVPDPAVTTYRVYLPWSGLRATSVP